MSSLMDTLPAHGAGGPFNGGGPGSTGLLSSNDELYRWLAESVVGGLFVDAVCGDGRCDAPEETRAVGRFGWSSPTPPTPNKRPARQPHADSDRPA